jgi:dynein heavy chain
MHASVFFHFTICVFLFPQLNYQFLKRCVESAPVTPMQQELFDHILQMIPPRLQATPELKEVIRELFEEISDTFNKSMKKSMGSAPLFEL